jgi:hypothetical protein
VPVLEPLQAGRVGAIARVSAHRRQGDPPGPRLLPQGEGQLRLGLNRARRWAPYRGAAHLRSGPGRGEREAGRQWPMHGGAAGRFLGDGVGADDALAIGHLAQGARRLARHADSTAPWLGQAGSVQQEQAVRRTLRDPGWHTLRVERLGLSGRIGQERL